MDVLNLGAGDRLISGAVNHDLTKHRHEIDVVHDLNVLPWPWADDSFDYIEARSVLEHLNIDLVQSFDECWRILRRGGMLKVKLPYWQHERCWMDPTHRRGYALETFDFFDPEIPLGKQYHFYTQRKWKVEWKDFTSGSHSSIAARMVVCK